MIASIGGGSGSSSVTSAGSGTTIDALRARRDRHREGHVGRAVGLLAS